MPGLSFLLLSLPFSGVGFSVGGVFLSSCFVGYFLFLFRSLNHISLKNITRAGLMLLLFLLACLFSNLFKNPISSFLGSFVILCLVTSPFFVGVHRKLCSRSFFEILKISYYLLIATILLEIVFYLFFGLNPALYSTLGIHGSSIEYYGLPRLRGFQLEPSILSYVAIFYLICFNLSPKDCGIGFLHRYSPVIIVTATMSSSGFLFLICAGLGLFLGRKGGGSQGLKLLSIYASIGVFVLSFPSLRQAIIKVLERIFDIYNVILTSNLSGSVGYRVHSLIEPISFYRDADFVYAMSGTGFSNYSDYIYDKYKHLEYSGFASGDLNSMLSAIAISTGILGLITFWGFVYFAYRSKGTSILSDTLFLFVVFLLFSYGNMSAPFVWIILFSLFCLHRMRRNDFVVDSNH